MFVFMIIFYKKLKAISIGIALSLFFLLCNCCSEKQQLHDIVVAELNGEKITLQQIDSIAASELYEIRLRTLKSHIAYKVIQNEAFTRGTSVDNVVINEIFLKTDYKGDDENVLHLKKKERQNKYVDSLIISKYNLNVLLEEPIVFVGKIDLISDALFSNSSAKSIELIFFFDYNCGTCVEVMDKYIAITKKYSSSINSVYVPFTSSFDIRHFATIAAGKFGKNTEIVSFLIKFKGHFSDEILINWAVANGINSKRFIEEINNPKTELLLTNISNELIRRNIFNVPSIIVNGNLLSVSTTPEKLETYILKH